MLALEDSHGNMRRTAIIIYSVSYAIAWHMYCTFTCICISESVQKSLEAKFTDVGEIPITPSSDFQKRIAVSSLGIQYMTATHCLLCYAIYIHLYRVLLKRILSTPV